jgi:hypothetical protein
MCCGNCTKKDGSCKNRLHEKLDEVIELGEQLNDLIDVNHEIMANAEESK